MTQAGGLGWSSLGKPGDEDGEFNCPVALAIVPGLGLVVREYWTRRLQQVFGARLFTRCDPSITMVLVAFFEIWMHWPS